MSAYRTPDAASSDADIAASPAQEKSSDEGSGSGSGRLVLGGYLIAGVLALVPVVRMIGTVLDGSKMQRADYWMMLPRFLNPGRGLDFVGLFHFQNEHPVVVPQFLYWLNVRAFSGSNITLGLVVVGLVVGQLVVVALLLRHRAFRPLDRMVIIVLASVLLFDLTGTHNFASAMSGTAWLSANLFALIAVYLRSRDRPVSAFALAVVAAVSYGTGIIAWPAVIATGVCRRPIKECWREWPYTVGFVATYAWYRASGPGGSGEFSDPMAVIRASANMCGFVLGLHGHAGELIGYIALIGVPVLAIYFFGFSRVPGTSAWVGLATYGWLAMMEISAGRIVLVKVGTPDRYTSLPAITWIGFASLLVLARRDVARRLTESREKASASPLRRFTNAWVVLVIAVPLMLGGWTAGQGFADRFIAQNPEQERIEIALRFGLSNNTRLLLGIFGSSANITDLLRDTGHYPFVGSWDLDCGLHGKRIPVAAGGKPPAITGEVLSSRRARDVLRSVDITGRVSDTRRIRCIVVANGRGVVVGAATVGDDVAGPGVHRPSETEFRALASAGARVYNVFVILEDDATPRLLGTVRANEITFG